MTNKAGVLILVGIGAILKLLITGICLSIGFRIGTIINQKVEAKLVKPKGAIA